MRLKNAQNPRLSVGEELPILDTAHAQNHGNNLLMFVSAASPSVLCMYNFVFKSVFFLFIVIIAFLMAKVATGLCE